MEITSSTSVPFPFQEGSTIGVYGPTCSGKSSLIARILENKKVMFETEPQKVLYCYGIYTDSYHALEQCMPEIEFRKGLPLLEEIETFANGKHNLIILDDLMADICKQTWSDKIFTMYSHHLKLSIIFVSQNLFPQSKNMRNIALNLKYLIMFSSPRDIHQLGLLGSQLGERKKLLEAYTDAVLHGERFSYLLIDLTPSCDKKYRWRTKIFPEKYTVIYA
jgi:hypothetical protein